MLMLCLLVGAFWLANALSGGSAGGQPPKSEPAPAPPAATIAQQTPVIRSPFIALPVIPGDTPLKDLLPIPPKARSSAPRLIDDISEAPEVAFQEPLAKSPEALKLTAHTMAKINH